MLVTTYLTSSPPHLLPRSPPKSPTHLLLNLLPKPSGGDLGGDLGGDRRRKVSLLYIHETSLWKNAVSLNYLEN